MLMLELYKCWEMQHWSFKYGLFAFFINRVECVSLFHYWIWLKRRHCDKLAWLVRTYFVFCFLFFFIQDFSGPPKKMLFLCINLSVEIFMLWLVKWEKCHASRKYWHSMFLAILSISRFTCRATWRLVGTMKSKNRSLVPSLLREETNVFRKFNTKHATF